MSPAKKEDEPSAEDSDDEISPADAVPVPTEPANLGPLTTSGRQTRNAYGQFKNYARLAGIKEVRQPTSRKAPTHRLGKDGYYETCGKCRKGVVWLCVTHVPKHFI